MVRLHRHGGERVCQSRMRRRHSAANNFLRVRGFGAAGRGFPLRVIGGRRGTADRSKVGVRGGVRIP